LTFQQKSRENQARPETTTRDDETDALESYRLGHGNSL
jgi:hypothetical protein